MSQESIKTLLDKINLLFNVFMKEGLDKVSKLEKELLKEQIQKLLIELDQVALTENSPDTVKVETEETAPEPIVNESQKLDEVETQADEEALLPDSEIKKEEELPAVEVVNTPIQEPIKEKAPLQNEAERSFNSNKPSRSLKEIIDLNKSFILKAELFNNKHEDYAEFIGALNNLQTEEASVKLVEAKAKELSWDEEDKAYELLVRAVEKRFLPLLQQ